MSSYYGGGNHNFSLSDYYDYYVYEIEAFAPWEDTVDVKVLNRAFIVVSVIIALLDLFILVTVFSASAREKSASWYLYHLNIVTILQVTFSLPRMEIELHNTFGACMFFSFTEWTFKLVYYVNMALMDIEIFATILASNSRWKSNPQKRFFISMAAAWISCILFSAVVKFFGHEEHGLFPICFNMNRTAEILGRVMLVWIPAFVLIIFIIAGSVIFIRTKRSPENYTHIAANRNSLQIYNEWFACFMTWNSLVFLTEILLTWMFIDFFELGIFVDISLQMITFLVHILLPLSGLLLEPVRETYVEWVKTGFQFVTGINQSKQARAADTQMLNMEACE